MTLRTANPNPDAITYAEHLRRQIESPGTICGPPVIDDRRWWQHLPGLNPYADLERAARQAAHEAQAEAG